ncbi:MAG: prepilin-type N-terminal cleavage/methylation domain-containing protein [Verrucomicrobia bacterium]|nr:prepilin-type N-terminal cleavage/methylation domain-containing protein [Verrucomicrobiota bacterium]
MMTSPTGSTRITDKRTAPPDRIRRRGFTLLELITVMVLLAAVIAISMPSLRNFFKSRNLVEESRRMLALTEFARREAVSTGIPIQMRMDLDRRLLSIQREDGYTNNFRAMPGPFMWDENLNLDFDQSIPIYGNVYIVTFLPDGTMAPEAPQSWRIWHDSDEERAFTIAKLPGQIQYSLLTANDPSLAYLNPTNQINQSGRIHLR